MSFTIVFLRCPSLFATVLPLLLVLSGFVALILRPLCRDCIATHLRSVCRDLSRPIFVPFVAIYRAPSSFRLSRFITIPSSFRLSRFIAIQRVLSNIDDKDGRCSAFMHYASSRLDGLSRSGVSSCSSPVCPALQRDEFLRFLRFLRDNSCQ